MAHFRYDLVNDMDEKEVKSIFGTFFDISDQKATEKKEKIEQFESSVFWYKVAMKLRKGKYSVMPSFIDLARGVTKKDMENFVQLRDFCKSCGEAADRELAKLVLQFYDYCMDYSEYASSFRYKFAQEARKGIRNINTAEARDRVYEEASDKRNALVEQEQQIKGKTRVLIQGGVNLNANRQ